MTFTWTGFLAALRAAVAAVRANKPLPAQPPMTGAQVSAAGKELQAALAKLVDWGDAHPGAIAGADVLLDYAQSIGLGEAAQIEAGVDAAPAALREAEAWLPYVMGALAAFQPAPSWRPGPTPFDPR